MLKTKAVILIVARIVLPILLPTIKITVGSLLIFIGASFSDWGWGGFAPNRMFGHSWFLLSLGLSLHHRYRVVEDEFSSTLPG